MPPEQAPTVRSVDDKRSALVLVECLPANGGWTWHGMAFVAGENINDIYGQDRTNVLDDCICSVAAAGVEVEPGEGGSDDAE